MRRGRRLFGLRWKLLLSYVLIVVIGLVGLMIAMRLIAPPLFDRIVGHMNGAGMGPGASRGVDSGIRSAFAESLVQALVISGVGSLIVAVLLSLYISDRITAPLLRIVHGSRRIASGDFRARVDTTDADEIGELAHSFNEMAAQLEDSEQRRVRLIGDVAHELRTPLATLSGYLEGLLDEVVTPSPELWSQLQGEVARLTRLTDDLQELSRLEAGQITLDRRAIAPSELIKTAINRLTPAFADKGVVLETGDVSSLPDVLADGDRVTQVLTNLLTNALRYTPSGGSVMVIAETSDGAVEFHVRDTGSGIPADQLQRIFERFYRIDPARSRARGGSGIGLTIARALVEAHGGRIWAESTGPGQGSTFSFTLPRA